MKKLLLGTLCLVTVLGLTGCDQTKENKKTKKDKNTHICIKKNIKQKNSVSKENYTEDIELTAKLDKNKKLLRYTMNYTYTYETKKACEDSCDIKTKWNDEINDKNYSGTKRTTTCTCKDKKVQEIYEYDIPNLDKYLRVDIPQLKKDDTFDLNTWLKTRKKYKYDCN